MADSIIEVKNLKKYFPGPGGSQNHAVDDLTFSIERGKTLGVVGESGCGKSTLGRTIIRLQEATDGTVLLDGEDITHGKGNLLKRVHENCQIIFQDPYSSLNPRMTIDTAVTEPMKYSKKIAKADRKAESERLMDMVGIDERLRRAYPHELDGGRRQRVVIARALALNPEFIVCDEPVSALDVSIQAQVLNLLMDLQDQLNLSYMFVTHDLSVVRLISDDILVMYVGQMVEKASTKDLFEHRLHPYTKALFSAIPSADLDHPMERIQLKGEISSPIDPKPGCRFATRCVYATEQCQEPQELREIEPNHFVACCRVEEVNS